MKKMRHQGLKRTGSNNEIRFCHEVYKTQETMLILNQQLVLFSTKTH